MTRSRRKREEIEEEPNKVVWEEYVEENVINQLKKFPGIEINFSEFEELIASWTYQYSMMWLSNVCGGYWTQNLSVGKAWWGDIGFDERLMLADYKSGWRMDSRAEEELEYQEEEEEDTGEFEEVKNMFEQILTRMVRSLDQNKQALLRDWDEIVKYHVSNSSQNAYLKWYTEGEEEQFAELGIVKQFEIIYHVIKLIERKNIGFRNYLLNHLDIFQFPEIWEDNSTSLVVMPTGKILRKAVEIEDEKDQLHVPIKLENCVLMEETDKSINVIPVDFSDQVSGYMKNVKVHYTTLTHDYISFLEFLQEVEDADFQEFFQGIIGYHAEAEVYGRKLNANRIKQQSLQALMVRRKRSSRLVAREEELHKKELETKWAEKLDGRDHFLRQRQRAVTKRCKKLKDTLWSILWDKFEKDSRSERMRRRADSIEQHDIDEYTLSHGENFKKWIMPLTEDDEDATRRQINTLEIPAEWCITQEDLSKLKQNNIPTHNYQPDNQDWFLDCICGIHFSSDFKRVKDSKIVCCEKCLKWQHWECQQPYLLEILSYGHDHSLTPKELGAVTMYDENLRRRSSRRDPSTTSSTISIENRPTDRKHTDTAEPFICNRCLNLLESELRSAFPSQLKLIRDRERKKSEEREKRRKAKEEKKRQKEQTNITSASPHSSTTVSLTPLNIPNLPSTTTPTPVFLTAKPQPALWQLNSQASTSQEQPQPQPQPRDTAYNSAAPNQSINPPSTDA